MNKAPATLAGKPGTRRARKLPEQVQVRFARTPGICRTLEGDVRYDAGDAMVEAPAGDRWPVRREVFRERYEPVPPTPAMHDGRYRKRSMRRRPAWCFRAGAANSPAGRATGWSNTARTIVRSWGAIYLPPPMS